MANAIRHGGGNGQLRVWHDGELYCEVRDHRPGFDSKPYVGAATAQRPSANGGMGLWIAQQMAQAIRIDSSPAGTTILLRTSLTD